jgi:hypothetical protein
MRAPDAKKSDTPKVLWWGGRGYQKGNPEYAEVAWSPSLGLSGFDVKTRRSLFDHLVSTFRHLRRTVDAYRSSSFERAKNKEQEEKALENYHGPWWC